MKTRLVAIGKSRGVRIPKWMIRGAGIADEVDIQLRDDAIVITPVMGIRSEWTQSAKILHARKGDRLLAEEMMRIGKRAAALPDLDRRSPDEILGYGEEGVPH